MTSSTSPVDHHHAHGPANRGRRVLETSAPLFVRWPETPPRTAVVVLHDVYGLTGDVERRCATLAAHGQLAVAPYFYYETGGREFTTTSPERARRAWARLTEASKLADVAGALDHLRRRCGIPPESITLLGIGAGADVAAAASTHYGVDVMSADVA